MTSILFKCPHCSQSLEADSDMANMPIECPTCNRPLSVPGLAVLVSKTLPRPKVLYKNTQTPTQTTNTPEHAQTNASCPPAFALSRVMPMLIYCICFGWISSKILPDRYFIDDQLSPILMLAASSIMLAVLTSSYFIRPVIFPKWQALVALLFTMFIGLFVLLKLQSIAADSLNMPFRNYGKATSGLLILKTIGNAYNSINSNDIGQQFFGYIFGVGLCEEMTKLLPLFYLILRNKTSAPKLEFRNFLMIGFFSGLGFGIGEAFYLYAPWSGNLSTNSNITRWFACVPSHAIYTVIDAAFLWFLAPKIKASNGLYRRLGLCALATLAVAIVHGIYDVLCGIPLLGIVLNALSILLMYKVVNAVAKHTKQPDDVPSIIAYNTKNVMGWVSAIELGHKRFLQPFIIVCMIILASLLFSSSEAQYQRRIQLYQRQPYEGYNNQYQSGGQIVYPCPNYNAIDSGAY